MVLFIVTLSDPNFKFWSTRRVFRTGEANTVYLEYKFTMTDTIYFKGWEIKYKRGHDRLYDPHFKLQSEIDVLLKRQTL